MQVSSFEPQDSHQFVLKRVQLYHRKVLRSQFGTTLCHCLRMLQRIGSALCFPKASYRTSKIVRNRVLNREPIVPCSSLSRTSTHRVSIGRWRCESLEEGPAVRAPHVCIIWCWTINKVHRQATTKESVTVGKKDKGIRHEHYQSRGRQASPQPRCKQIQHRNLPLLGKAAAAAEKLAFNASEVRELRRWGEEERFDITARFNRCFF